MSQLALAADASTTPRYVSFVETGRAQPSRQMVARLARALDVPLRERNELSFFSVVSTIGTPIDVTAQELRVEAFFPADDATRDRWTSMAR